MRCIAVYMHRGGSTRVKVGPERPQEKELDVQDIQQLP
jgi:hypothetical protein